MGSGISPSLIRETHSRALESVGKKKRGIGSKKSLVLSLVTFEFYFKLKDSFIFSVENPFIFTPISKPLSHFNNLTLLYTEIFYVYLLILKFSTDRIVGVPT